jgi:diaminopimelate decarboxylase
MESTALQSALKNFEVVENQLMVAGRSVAEWAKEYSTPLYLYDSSVIKKKVSLFREVMPSEIELYYAVKANPFSGLLREMVNLADGFDVASFGELEAVISAGGDPQTISFAGPGKRREELSRAIELGIGSINVESEKELELIIEEGRKFSKTPKVSIRINPDFELHGSGMKMGGGAKQFGIDSDRVPAIMEKISDLPIDFQGFHVYAGSQNLFAEAISDVLDKTLEVMFRFAEPFADSIKLLNLGGGFGIPYFDEDQELNLTEVGNALKDLIKVYLPHFPGAQFIIELGRYLVGESGLYITKILYRKKSRGKTFLVIDGGMNHHLAASGNFGQVLKKNYPILIGNRIDFTQTETVNIAGPLCTPLDLLGSSVNLPEADEEDFVVVMNSGAYGYSASPLLFLSHETPKEVLI